MTKTKFSLQLCLRVNGALPVSLALTRLPSEGAIEAGGSPHPEPLRNQTHHESLSTESTIRTRKSYHSRRTSVPVHCGGGWGVGSGDGGSPTISWLEGRSTPILSWPGERGGGREVPPPPSQDRIGVPPPPRKNLASETGYPLPRVDRQMPVKTLPSCRTTCAGG